jgi:glucose uptake protein
MFTPASSSTALLLIVVSMLCWGSWPNLLKALPGWRLEYFYFDYTIGFLLAMLLIGATAGSTSLVSFDFLDRLLAAGSREATLAVAGGLLWNIGNIFLLNSIMIAGLAVAFPIASVLAITLGVGISYWAQPIGNPAWLIAGSIVLVVAAWANAQAYRELGGSSASKKRAFGIVLALVAGFLVGIFPPFVAGAISGEHALDPYVATILFMLGASIATIVGIPLLLKKPFIGEAASLGGYTEGSARAHVLGWLAGAIWCLGTFSNFVSAGLVGVAVSWGIGSGAPMVGALWGILLWKEFDGASRRAWLLIATSLALYAAGVVLVAIAYQLR